MRIKELQDQVDHWIKTYGVRYFNETTNTLLLTEEVGEFSRIVARLFGEQSFKSKQDEIEAKDQLEDEMADILFVLTCLANQMDIDLEKAVQKNLLKKTKRDATRHITNEKLKD